MKKILVDVGHPAHIHYFKNAARILGNDGYEFLFVVRERDSTLELIQDLGFNYVPRGQGGKNLLTKLLNIPIINYKIYKIAKQFKPDLFLSFLSMYAGQVAWLMRKPHIAFTDTEHAIISHALSRPFSNVVLSPSYYFAKLARNQFLFHSYMELCYMHPNYFTPDRSVLQQIGVTNDEKYCIIRFVAWDANHDVGQGGFNANDKIELVKELYKVCKVCISSEGKLPQELEEFRLKTHPKWLHHALNFASLYIGEGSTTATEAVLLGTPAIYVNSLVVGSCLEEEKYGLLYQYKNMTGVLEKAKEILNEDKGVYLGRREKLLREKIDPTAFMVWFIKEWPHSLEKHRVDPNYQRRF